MIHPTAAAGFDRGTDDYRRSRPGYHPVLVERFVEHHGRGVVLEVGAGTGILTAQLVAQGLSPIAVEPVASMRATLAEELPGLDVREGTAERLPVDAGSVDTVVVAQAFHWFDHGPALDEAARALRPGGHLVTVWNVKDGDEPWYRRYMEVIDRHADDTPRHADLRWRRAIDGDRRFEPIDDWAIDNSRTQDTEAVVGRALSTSYIAALPDARRDAVAEEIRAIVDEVGGTVRFPYRGELQAWRLRGSEEDR